MNHFMLLVTLLSGVCASLERPQLQILKTTFSNCRDLTTSGATLVDLQATSAVISKMSIVSRVVGRLALLESVDSSVLVKKCAFEGLASYFAHVSGGSVAVTSSSFADSARPLTIEGVLGGGSLGRSLERASVLACLPVSASGAYSVSGTTFDGCQHQGKEGGAIHFSGTSLSITKCTFKNCKAANAEGRWGDAIYSSADIGAFVLEGCTFESFDQSNTIAHFQRRATPTQFDTLTLSNNIFKSTSVISDQAGGSGLLIRYAATLELVGCEFEQCTCLQSGGALMFEAASETTPTFAFTECSFLNVKTTEGNGGAIALPHACKSVTISGCLFQNNRAPTTTNKYGGSLYFHEDPGALELRDTIFIDCMAQEGGCIDGFGYVTSLTIDNVTVNKCDSNTYPIGYSIYVYASTVSVSRVHLWNMTRRGLVVLQNGEFWPGDNFDLYGSSFRNVEMGKLFDAKFTGLSYVNLTDCVFYHCTFFDSGSDAYQAPIDFSGSMFVMNGCIFTNDVNSPKAIAFAVGSGECSIEGCRFETVKSDSSSMFWLTGFSSVSVVNTSFIDSRTLAQPILKMNVSAAKLFDCVFYDCACDGESMIVLSDCATVNVTLTALRNCSCKSGALVAIADAGSVFITSSCFQGLTERPGVAGYIDCTCESATFELPMCFSMSEAASISIKESSSSSLNYPSTIFNCRDCSFIPDSESGGTDNSPSNGLSVPVIVGIAIGALVLVSLVILIVVLVIRRKKSDQDEKSLDDDLNEMTEEGEVESTITSIMSEEWTQKMTEDARGMTTNGVGMANMINEPFPEFEEAF